MRQLIYLASLLAFAKTLPAQDVSPQAFAVWAQRNAYVASRDYRSYLLIAPGNLGPNGLPVWPTLRGRVDSVMSFSVSGNHHRTSGDVATDLSLAMHYPFGRKASLRLRYTLREWYDYSEAVAFQRNTVRPAGQGSAAGDIYVEGLFQVLRDLARWPDLALTVRVKTASGGDIESMRFSDTPGYAFDVSGGKEVSLPGGRYGLRPYASAGFFVWQRFGESAPQNDAFTFAAGSEFLSNQLRAYAELAGYVGYTGELDQPVVLRAGVELPLGNVGLLVGADVSHGLHDWAYTSGGLTLAWEL